MQALTQIGFTEKDFELASKLIEIATKANKFLAEKADMAVEYGPSNPIGKMFAEAILDKFVEKKQKARQENDELIELQYKMMKLKKLIAQDGASRQTMG